MQVNLQDGKLFWPSSSASHFGRIHSQLLDKWPCKTHSSVIMLSKCFFFFVTCQWSVLTRSCSAVSRFVTVFLFHVRRLMWAYLIAGYVSLISVTLIVHFFKSCLSVFGERELINCQSLREVVFDSIKRMQTGPGVMIPESPDENMGSISLLFTCVVHYWSLVLSFSAHFSEWKRKAQHAARQVGQRGNGSTLHAFMIFLSHHL